MNNKYDQHMDDIEIKETLTDSYMSYASAVNFGRSIPDLRDGLKPVQRRILQGLLDVQGKNRTRFIKSARVVGEVLGRYHPHGDSSIYSAAIALSTSWGNRVPLIKTQGNNGSIAGDSAAASRYTEIMSSDFIGYDKDVLENYGLPKSPTYDNLGEEYTLLDLGFPNVLINGTFGVGVSISTYIPSFNPKELFKALSYIIDRQELDRKPTVKGIAKYIKGPDFPTGGSVYSPDWLDVLEKGSGKIVHEVDLEYYDKTVIIRSITTDVTTTLLISQIGKVAKELGIKNIVEYSDSNGIHIELTYKKDVIENDIHTLYNKTSCSISRRVNITVCDTYGVGRKGVLEILESWLKFTFINRVTMHTKYIQITNEALLRYSYVIHAYKHLNKVISIIRKSDTNDEARDNLMKVLGINEYHAEFILGVKLSIITKTYINKVKAKMKELTENIKETEKLLDHPFKIKRKIIEEGEELLKTVSRRRSRVTGFINRDISADTKLCVYLDTGTVSARLALPNDVAEGNIHILNGNQTLVFITDDGVAYRIPTSRLSDVSSSPMKYIAPRDIGVSVIAVAVYSEKRPLKMYGANKNHMIDIPANLVVGVGGKKFKLKKKKYT